MRDLHKPLRGSRCKVERRDEFEEATMRERCLRSCQLATGCDERFGGPVKMGPDPFGPLVD